MKTSTLLNKIADAGIRGYHPSSAVWVQAQPLIEEGLVTATPHKYLLLTPKGYKEIQQTPLKMSYALAAFVTKVRDILGAEYARELHGPLLSRGQMNTFGYYSQDISEPHLKVEWSTGGLSGGSCYSSGRPEPYTSDDPPENLGSLDHLLEQLIPNLGFRAYNAIVSAVVEYTHRTQSEYYGNCTNYTARVVRLKKLMEYLEENNLIPQENSSDT